VARARTSALIYVETLGGYGMSHAPSGPNALVVEALQTGGCVLVMRHASAPMSRPESHAAETDNASCERQLDDSGKACVRAMGQSISQLRIRLDEVFSSPTYRARETVRLAGFLEPRIITQLDELTTGNADSAWLCAKIVQPPQPGTNVLIVTHMPNILDSLDGTLSNIAPGEVLVFRPESASAVELLARIRIECWSLLAQSVRQLPSRVVNGDR
jgi:phosphohistidine phosphatase SixA